MQACPLCLSSDSSLAHSEQGKRDYYRCTNCELLFTPPSFWLDANAEKAIYDYHQNSPNDEGYRQFLSRLVEPLQQCLTPASNGLDFGSGPGPTLSIMLEELGFNVALYDRFYAPNEQAFNNQYDFITATEVVEHLQYPRRELDRLWQHLKVGGYLGFMTKLVPDDRPFLRWHYKNDLTHIVFYSQATFAWLAQHWQAKLTIIGTDVILLQKLKA